MCNCELNSTTIKVWECAKGAAKASCGETVVQKCVFGESVSTLPPQGQSGPFRRIEGQTLRGQRRNGLSKNTFWTTVSPHDAFAAPLTHTEKFQKPGDHPNFRKNALGVKRPFSELSESSGVFSEQLSECEIPFSEYEISFSEWHSTT